MTAVANRRELTNTVIMIEKSKKLFSFLRKVWQLSYPYWLSQEKWIARGLLATIITLNLSLVSIQVLVNKWYAVFYNALQEKNFEEFKIQLLWFCLLAFFHIIFAVYQLYLTQMLQIRWRRWLTDDYLKRWFKNRLYFRFELQAKENDNPDQRIVEDLQDFTSQTLAFMFGLMNAIVTLVSFVIILWTISGPLQIGRITIPGYMVWAALIYAIGGTWFTHWLGFPLVKINFDLQKYTAHFRYNLVRFRENAESIALYHGEKSEKKKHLERFQNIWETWWKLMVRQKKLTWFTSSYSQLAIIFPLVVAAPRYFAGHITLGVLMQISSAFRQVQESLSWFIVMYSNLAGWKASVDRLLTFEESLDRLQADMDTSNGIQIKNSPNANIHVHLDTLSIPSGKVLLDNKTIEFKHGEHTIIKGPSGCGKSTLFRAISGIWPFGRGDVNLPSNAILFLPQKAYLPIDTIRNIVCYPSSSEQFGGEEINEALTKAKLDHLKDRLDIEENWAQYLSPGEQQRLGFVRALLHKPDWLLMDESTSSLDQELEYYLYHLLKKELPNCTLVSIAHRTTVDQFHDKTLHFVNSDSGMDLVFK